MANEIEKGKGFLGAGIAFPLGLTEADHLRMNSLEDHVRQSIQLILETAKGERVMRPDFGSGLRDLVFSPVSSATLALVRHEVQDAVIRFEPRIDVLGVTVSITPDQPERLNIELKYRVRETDTLFNLVYPFYLDRGET